MASVFAGIRKRICLFRSSLFVTTVMASSGSSTEKKLNRLAHEKSPYLLQHASNPVDWYPWGQEAFSKSKAENKPIFLSVGYSTCHWCHVMERESFESEKIAQYLNENFISIKVDREERPDVDRVYMTFVQATQGGGGWPMSVFLTPDLKPFIGGTYFPPEDSLMRPGFLTILTAIKQQWEKDHDKINQKMIPLMEALEKSAVIRSKDPQMPGSACIQRAAESLQKNFDTKYGGFGRHPKFPQPVILDMLLRVYGRFPDSSMGEEALQSTLFTLKAMSNGGIHDHISQGFHRYSTDQYWHVPHFEKMLYDQAQLVTAYIDAYQISKDLLMRDVAKDILLYVSRDLSDESGGFYSAEDADSLPFFEATEKMEGAFCVWSWEEIQSLLLDPLPGGNKTLADLFSRYYGIRREGNVDTAQDPHGELKNRNVLIIRDSIEEVAGEFSLATDEAEKLLKQARETLYKFREKRPKPHRDDKILTSWNGLMISAFARASQVIGEPRYLERAEKAGDFIKKFLYVEKTRRLLRNAYRDKDGVLSVGNINGFSDDYAFLIRGLLDLFEASHNSKWLEWAYELQQQQDKLFLDTKDGGYFSTSGDDSSILVRMKEDQDGSEPSSNSVAAMNLLRLSSLLDKPDLRTRAGDIFKAFCDHMSEHPAAFAGMVSAYICYLQKPKQIIVVGNLSSEDTKKLLQAVHSYYIPNKTLIAHDLSNPSLLLVNSLPALKDMELTDSKATAYVCEDYRCSAPTNCVETLKKMLNPKIRI